jgi:hypothetical protein
MTISSELTVLKNAMENLITNKHAGMRRNIFSAAFLAEKIRGKEGRFLFGLALITRIIAFPFANVVEADAGARLFIAEHAWRYGGELSSYQWPSLQIYILSFFQMISGDRVLGPAIFDLLIGAGVVVPFYRFTKNLFNEKGAFYTALIFTFCPLVFRNSFLPLSEVYNLFFCVTGLWCLSEGLIHPEKKFKWALLAGLSITLACGGRFEAWVLAVTLGGILLVLRQWKMFFVFGIASSIFPVCWLLVCYFKMGDALLSVHMVERQNFEISKVNNVIWNKIEYFRRIFFFPFSWLVSLTPVVAFIISLMMFRVCRHFRKNKTLFLFALLFVFWMLFFMYEAFTGNRVTQHRFTLITLFLSLPFYALWFERPEKMRLKKIVSIAIAVLIIPWSFYWQWIPWQKLGLGRKTPHDAITQTVPTTFWEIQAVPMIQPRIFVAISDSINANLHPGDGVFIDYCDWNPTSFLALQSHLPADDIFQAFDYSPHHGDNGKMSAFFHDHSKGLFVLSDFSTLLPEIHLHGPFLEFDSVPGGLLLKPVINNAHYRLFQYVYINANETEIQRQKFNLADSLFHVEKDAEFYAVLNYRDAGWLSSAWLKALDDHISLDKQVHLNAGWMVEQDNLKKEQEKNKSDSINK